MKKMDLLVIGSGGREHAIAWKLSQSPGIEKIYCSPGNGGISSLATLVPNCAENDWNSYADFVKEKGIDLTIVGPEKFLAEGLVDCFRKRGLRIFGPDQKAAKLESSKAFAKEFMKKYKIPTANFKLFDDPSKAIHFASHLPVVIKADGLASGKGVFVCETAGEVKDAIDKLMVKKVFGSAGEKVIIEEKLVGEEFSLMAFCDGRTIKRLPPARDYKRVYDQDQGPNTGGMGSLAPSFLSDEQLKKIEKLILNPFLEGIQSEGLGMAGIIYFGLMLSKEEFYVLEFNVRFGDPETEVVLPLVQTDLLDLFNSVVDKTLEKVPLKISNEFCVGVVCASGGYPGNFEIHKEISGLDSPFSNEESIIFHAGTTKEDGQFYTTGGRVLIVVGKGKSLAEAREKSYKRVSKINFEKMHYRREIGN